MRVVSIADVFSGSWQRLFQPWAAASRRPPLLVDGTRGQSLPAVLTLVLAPTGFGLVVGIEEPVLRCASLSRTDADIPQRHLLVTRALGRASDPLHGVPMCIEANA